MKKYILILFSTICIGQASNQMVTFTAAQSLGFSLKPGQSSVTSNKCATKTEALAKYNLNASSMNAYTDNQLVPKSAWVSGVTSFVYTLGSSAVEGNSTTCTDNGFSRTMYAGTSSIVVGTVLYIDSGLTTLQIQTGSYVLYYIATNQLLTISGSNGSVLSISSCNISDTTAPSAPTLLISNNAQNQISLSWNIPTDASGINQFVLYFGTSANPAFYTSLSGTTTTIVIGGNSPSTTYYAKIQAIDGASNYSLFSSTVSVVTGLEIAQ